MLCRWQLPSLIAYWCRLLKRPWAREAPRTKKGTELHWHINIPRSYKKMSQYSRDLVTFLPRNNGKYHPGNYKNPQNVTETVLNAYLPTCPSKNKGGGFLPKHVWPIDRFHCHAEKLNPKPYSGWGQEIVMLWKIKREDTSPSLKSVRFAKFYILGEMFRRNLQSPVWKRHIGVPLWYTNMAAGK